MPAVVHFSLDGEKVRSACVQHRSAASIVVTRWLQPFSVCVCVCVVNACISVCLRVHMGV